MAGKSASWLATQVLTNPESSIRYIWAKEPTTLERLLRALQWTPEQFAKETGLEIPSLSRPVDALPVRRYRIPIVDAGAGLPVWNEGGEFVILDLPELRGKPESELFAVRIQGDSMSPTYLNGDVVVCWTQGQPESGRVVAVHQHGDGLIIKRLQMVGSQVMLYSDNPAYPPMLLGEYDRVYGVALGMWRPVR
ncbi:S24 family peptidase [Meiothermus sp.]|uniref:S24 family peptidase n=1 Tax=Meiothermus sp. TaxID=1955249 RepID=UPI0025E52B88|nr:S24 family peptidase [Meiothermus sp.]